MSEMIRIEVAYALPGKQHIARLEVPVGTTAREAADRAALEVIFDGLAIDDTTKLGIFGKAVPQAHVLRAGERVEIYRPLIADPKAARKARAEKAKAARAAQPDGGD
jgi:hypothetical protein